MRLALALALALGCAAAPVSAQLPAPWIEQPLPPRFGQVRALTCADDVAFARSWQGNVARFEGRAWAPLERVPGRGNVGSTLFSDSRGSVLFTTTDDGIARWSNGRWTTDDAPIGPARPRQMLSFDGEHAITGGRGRVIAWSGAQYDAYDAATWRDVFAIWGLAEDELWIGGGAGVVARFDGGAFQPRRIETDGAVVLLWGSTARDLWAVVESPSGVFHWDGARWSDRTGNLAREPITAVGGPPDQVHAVGSFGVVRWEGDGWRDVARVAADPYDPPRFRAVCATRTSIVVAEDEDRSWVRPRDDVRAR